MKTRKIKAAGRYGVRGGVHARRRLVKIEEKQRKKQICPYCKKPKLKKLSKGIWKCKKCNKKFASDVYYIEN